MDRITGPADDQESTVQRVQGDTVEQAREIRRQMSFWTFQVSYSSKRRLYHTRTIPSVAIFKSSPMPQPAVGSKC